MTIFLIGYMGSGKSTLGRKLAERLDVQFLDLDVYIEERNFATIPEIFANEGEAAFREKEHKALKEVAQFDDVIIATGGGAPCFYNNMNIMNEAGVCVYLDVHPNMLAERLLKSKTERPLIKGKSKPELEEFLTHTLEQRNSFYKQAKLIIEVLKQETIDDLAEHIEERVKEILD